ncbi:MAG: VOC family protein [Bacteroidales bacterium]|nr:VOC family protein [Bacteroidales bacterium]
MDIKHNVVGWFEIPVTKMDRAIRFYEAVFGLKLTRGQMGQEIMAFFPWVENTVGSGGALIHHPEHYKPSSDGILIYFTAFSGDVSIELGRVEGAGGKVLKPKTLISPEVGYMALFLDTEGNRIALHTH